MKIPPIPFEPFPKISRLRRNIVISEKIDGTNACIYIPDSFDDIHAASRTKWITPEDDNYGFAKWVESNRESLMKLGPGMHFGEWWGQGIQRKYGLTEKRFSLFNAKRWADPASRPNCVGIVPVLYEGLFDTKVINDVITNLEREGSVAAPGFMNPEGIVVYHTASGELFKQTIKKDDAPKGLSQES